MLAYRGGHANGGARLVKELSTKLERSAETLQAVLAEFTDECMKLEQAACEIQQLVAEAEPAKNEVGHVVLDPMREAFAKAEVSNGEAAIEGASAALGNDEQTRAGRGGV